METVNESASPLPKQREIELRQAAREQGIGKELLVEIDRLRNELNASEAARTTYKNGVIYDLTKMNEQLQLLKSENTTLKSFVNILVSWMENTRLVFTKTVGMTEAADSLMRIKGKFPSKFSTALLRAIRLLDAEAVDLIKAWVGSQ